MHQYRTHCAWTGSTGDGYEAYSRDHVVTTPPAAAELILSSDPAFRGDPARWNPEELLVAATSSCQLLSFLAVAARARLDVIAYTDDADAVMPDDDRSDHRPLRITRIVLHPRITVRGPATDARVRHLCEIAHRECYIANSLTSEVVVEPEITIVDVTPT